MKKCRSWRRDTNVWLWTWQVVGSIPIRVNEILNIFTSLFGCWGTARRWFPPPTTQCIQNSAENGKRSVLTLGSLWQLYSVRDTAWNKRQDIKHTQINMTTKIIKNSFLETFCNQNKKQVTYFHYLRIHTYFVILVSIEFSI